MTVMQVFVLVLRILTLTHLHSGWCYDVEASPRNALVSLLCIVNTR